MAESTSKWLFGVWSKLQERFSAAGSTSAQLIKPKLKQLNEMVYEVYCPPPEQKLELEIVLFHGLQVGSSKDAYFTTWMSRDNSQMWPQTWLVDAFPKARILTVAYDAVAKRTNEAGLLDMFGRGENLLSMLTSDFVHVGKDRCPIVLVGHSLGGLLLKELCLHANETLIEGDPKLPGMQGVGDFFRNLRAMFFYGTPHNGSLLDDKRYDSLDGSLMDEIKILNTCSARKNWKFCALQSRFKWRTFGVGEAKDTFVSSLGQYIRLVPEASSRADMDEYYSVDGNHYEICTPEGKHSAPFTLLRDFLHQIHQDGLLAPSIGLEYYVDSCGRAAKVQSMLEQPNGQIVFITGLPGIGKTALAKQVFQDNFHSFEHACFIHLDSIGSQLNDREQVLKKIEVELKQQDQGWNCDYRSVPLYLRGRKVLIIVDNVQSKCQLDALDREMWLMGSTSRLVLTTTDSQLGSSSNTFQVECLEWGESRDLFLHYAFEGKPIPEHLEHSIQEVIEKCADFPLCLKILGSYMSKGDRHKQNIWEDLIVRLKNGKEMASGHNYKFWGRLRPCYDALEISEQEMFLDVATLFCGWPLTIVEYIWSGCRHSPSMGWTNLVRRFLVNVDGEGRIWMHELLRKLGCSIACPQSSSVNKWRRASGESYAREFMKHCQGVADTLSLELQVRTNERLILKNIPFLQCGNLQYLILEGVEMTQESVELPGSLVFLRWKGGLFETCPVDFSLLRNLVVLELQYCKAMRLLPPNVVKLKKLKWLELEGCQSLMELPSELCEFGKLEYLGLSMTGLTELPNRLGKLRNLKDIRANQSQMNRVPKSIGWIKTLQSLNMSNTTVRTLPESIGELGMLQWLYIQNTAVEVLPESIGGLKSLIHLDARNTRLRSLPDSIDQLGELLWLQISNTAVEVLPESIGRLKSLTYLDACNTKLSSLPDSIGQLVELRDLWMNNTAVEVLPESIGWLRSLKFLNASHTRLSSLPDSIGRLGELVRLQISNTAVEVLPESIGRLRSLTFLDACNTKLSSLPDSIGRLGKLLWLQISNTAVEGLPESIGRLRSLTFLDACNTKLSSLPDSIGRLVELRDLWMNNTAVEVLPESIGWLKSLTFLNASHTRLSSLPDSIGRLGELLWLQISNTAVEVLPESIGWLRSLTLLDACDTRLSSLPDSIGRIVKLQGLLISNTAVGVLPESIGQLGMLRFLHIANTAVEVLPESIGQLRSLTLLDACNTKLSSLPNSIHQLKELRELWISNTPVEVPPEFIRDLKSLHGLGASNTLLSSLQDRIGCLQDLRSLDAVHACSTFFAAGKVQSELTILRENQKPTMVEEFMTKIKNGQDSGYFVSKAWMLSLEEHEDEELMSVLQQTGYLEIYQTDTTVFYEKIEKAVQDPNFYNDLSCTPEKNDFGGEDTNKAVAANDNGAEDKIEQKTYATEKCSPMERSDFVDPEVSTRSFENKMQSVPVRNDQTTSVDSPKSLLDKGKMPLAITNEMLESFKRAIKDITLDNYSVSTQWLSTLSEQEKEILDFALLKAGYSEVDRTRTTTYYERIQGHVCTNSNNESESSSTFQKSSIVGGAESSRAVEGRGGLLTNDRQHPNNGNEGFPGVETANQESDKRETCPCHRQHLMVSCTPEPSTSSSSRGYIPKQTTREAVGASFVTMPTNREGELPLATGGDKTIELTTFDFCGVSNYNEVPISLEVSAYTSLMCCIMRNPNENKVRIKFSTIRGKVKVGDKVNAEVEDAVNATVNTLVLRSVRCNVDACIIHSEGRSDPIALNVQESSWHRVLQTYEYDDKGQRSGADLVWLGLSQHRPRNSEIESKTIELQRCVKKRRQYDLDKGCLDAYVLNFEDSVPVILEGNIPREKSNMVLEFNVRYEVVISYNKHRVPPAGQPYAEVRREDKIVDFDFVLQFTTRKLSQSWLQWSTIFSPSRVGSWLSGS